MPQPTPVANAVRDPVGTVEASLEAGADCTLGNSQGEYPLQTAVTMSKTAVLEAMLRHDNPDVCPKRLKTALSVAALRGLPSEYGLFREHGLLVLRRLAGSMLQQPWHV